MTSNNTGANAAGTPTGGLEGLLGDPTFQVLSIAGSVITIGGLIYGVFIKAKPEAVKIPKETYIDDEKEKRTEIFDIELKYASNFFRRKFKLFRYKGEPDYEIWGGMIIPKKECEEKFERDYWWVFMKESQLIEYGRIGRLSINLRTDPGNYKDRLTVEISGSRAIITNSNDESVRFYSFPITGVQLTHEDIQTLRDDPKIHDVYSIGDTWYISVKEIPPTMFGNPGRERIKLDFLSKH